MVMHVAIPIDDTTVRIDQEPSLLLIIQISIIDGATRWYKIKRYQTIYYKP